MMSKCLVCRRHLTTHTEGNEGGEGIFSFLFNRMLSRYWKNKGVETFPSVALTPTSVNQKWMLSTSLAAALRERVSSTLCLTWWVLSAIARGQVELIRLCTAERRRLQQQPSIFAGGNSSGRWPLSAAQPPGSCRAGRTCWIMDELDEQGREWGEPT